MSQPCRFYGKPVVTSQRAATMGAFIFSWPFAPRPEYQKITIMVVPGNLPVCMHSKKHSKVNTIKHREDREMQHSSSTPNTASFVFSTHKIDRSSSVCTAGFSVIPFHRQVCAYIQNPTEHGTHVLVWARASQSN